MGVELQSLRPDDVNAVRVDGQEPPLGSSPPSGDIFDVSGNRLRKSIQDGLAVLISLSKMFLINLKKQKQIEIGFARFWIDNPLNFLRSLIVKLLKWHNFVEKTHFEMC